MNNIEKNEEICIRLTKILAEYGMEGVQNIRNFNYIIDGNLDSFEFLSFITDLEIEFSVKFTVEDISNKKYYVINELIELILNKIN